MNAGGIPALHTRAERWECDTNGHWNTRFYMRSFQSASVMAASLEAVGAVPGASSRWHMRFHKELFAGAPVEVRSSLIADGPHTGATLHRLISEGVLRATAIEDAFGRAALPPATQETVVPALPRGIVGPSPEPWSHDAERDLRTEVGYVRPADLAPDGRLYQDDLMARCAQSSTLLLNRLGFTPEFTERTSINRMLLELRTTLYGTCAAGECLSILSRVTSTGSKTFTTTHCLAMRSGTTLAVLELCMIAVDLRTRRAAPLPGFMTSDAA